MNPTRNHEAEGSIPGLAQVGQGSGVAMSCGVGRRCSSDPALLWLWHRLAAVALIRPLAWEPPHALGMALEKTKKKKASSWKKKKKKNYFLKFLIFLNILLLK